MSQIRRRRMRGRKKYCKSPPFHPLSFRQHFLLRSFLFAFLTTANFSAAPAGGFHALAAGNSTAVAPGSPAVATSTSGEVDKILREWHAATSGIRRLHGRHKRFVYDLTFEIEKRSHGSFYLERPGNWRFDFKGDPLAAGAVSRRSNVSGNPFQLASDISVRWISQGRTIQWIDDREKAVNILDSTNSSPANLLFAGPLPFLFALPPDKARKRFHFQLDQKDESLVWLTIRPRWPADAAIWREARVILDRDNRFMPKAIQLLGNCGRLETVYAFGDMQINPAPATTMRLFGEESPPLEPVIPPSYERNRISLDWGPSGMSRESRRNFLEREIPAALSVLGWFQAANAILQRL